MIYTVADILTGLIESVMVFLLCGIFCNKRESLPDWGYGIGIFLLAVMINVSNAIFHYGILNAIGVIGSSIAVSFLYEGTIKNRIIIPVLSFLLSATVEIMVLYGMVMVFRVSAENIVELPSYRLLGIILSKTLALVVVELIRLRFKRRQVVLPASYWLLFLLMFCTSIVAVFLIFKFSYVITENYLYNLSVLCSFGLLFCTFFALYLYEHLAEQAEIIRAQYQYEQHLKDQLKHFDEIFIAQKQLKSFKHDFSHFLIGLRAYLDNNDCENAVAYIDELSSRFSAGKGVIETGNAALDAVLSAKKALAESKKIHFQVALQIPERLPIDSMDLCVIFGNALDNAIEACDRVFEIEKEILVTAFYQKNVLFCKIENTALPQETVFPVTSKADKSNHGFGLDNIRGALAKYGGEPELTYEKNRFIVKFVLFLEHNVE